MSAEFEKFVDPSRALYDDPPELYYFIEDGFWKRKKAFEANNQLLRYAKPQLLRIISLNADHFRNSLYASTTEEQRRFNVENVAKYVETDLKADLIAIQDDDNPLSEMQYINSFYADDRDVKVCSNSRSSIFSITYVQKRFGTRMRDPKQLQIEYASSGSENFCAISSVIEVRDKTGQNYLFTLFSVLMKGSATEREAQKKALIDNMKTVPKEQQPILVVGSFGCFRKRDYLQAEWDSLPEKEAEKKKDEGNLCNALEDDLGYKEAFVLTNKQAGLAHEFIPKNTVFSGGREDFAYFSPNWNFDIIPLVAAHVYYSNVGTHIPLVLDLRILSKPELVQLKQLLDKKKQAEAETERLVQEEKQKKEEQKKREEDAARLAEEERNNQEKLAEAKRKQEEIAASEKAVREEAERQKQKEDEALRLTQQQEDIRKQIEAVKEQSELLAAQRLSLQGGEAQAVPQSLTALQADIESSDRSLTDLRSEETRRENDIREMQRRKKELEDQLALLVSEREKFQKRLLELESEIQRRESQVTTYRAQESALDAEIGRLNVEKSMATSLIQPQQEQSIQKEIDDLAAKIKNVEGSINYKNSLKMGSESTLRTLESSLQKDPTNKAYLDSRATEEAELVKTVEQIAELREELKQLSDDRNRKDQELRKLKGVRAEIEDRQKEIDALSAKIVELDWQEIEKKQDIEKTEKIKRGHEADLAAATEENDKFVFTGWIEQDTRKIETYKGELKNIEDEKARLVRYREQKIQAIEELKKRSAEQGKVQSSEEYQTKIDESTAKLQETKVNRRREQARIDTIIVDRNAAKESLEKANKDLAEAEPKLKKDISDREKEIASMLNELDDLRRKISALQADVERKKTELSRLQTIPSEEAKRRESLGVLQQELNSKKEQEIQLEEQQKRAEEEKKRLDAELAAAAAAEGERIEKERKIREENEKAQQALLELEAKKKDLDLEKQRIEEAKKKDEELRAKQRDAKRQETNVKDLLKLLLAGSTTEQTIEKLADPSEKIRASPPLRFLVALAKDERVADSNIPRFI